jgi:ABC-type Na+ efflux pump permease subunit
MRAADWLWANPVLRREWARGRPQTRRRSVGSWLGLALALTAYAAGAYWLSREERSPWEARAFLLALCLLYLLLVNIVVPGPAAARISGERERRTWQPLLLTALRPSQVVSAKLLASLWSSMAALGQLLPLLIMSAHAARLPAARLFLISGVLLASSTLAAAGSLWLSGRCRQTRTAIGLAYLMTALFFWIAFAGSPPHLGRWSSLWWYASPGWQTAVLCLAEPRRIPLGHPLLPEWAWFLLACAALSAEAMVLLLRRIARSEEA